MSAEEVAQALADVAQLAAGVLVLFGCVRSLGILLRMIGAR